MIEVNHTDRASKAEVSPRDAPSRAGEVGAEIG